jgi:hypothetical protein
VGYTTDFMGAFKLNKPLLDEQKAYLDKFNCTRRMKRDAAKTKLREDPVREAVNLDVGLEGAYFVGEIGFMGQGGGNDVLDHNRPPEGQPGLWCQWTPGASGQTIEWDGGEKFYNYIQWLEYIIEHFLKPWGYRLNGRVFWTGEDPSDIGTIFVENNCVRFREHIHERVG